MTKHGAPAAAYTASELLAVMASRLLNDGQIVFAGVGIPLLAATLAQRNFAPHLTILFEGGTIGPFIVPGELPPSTNEQRCTWIRTTSGLSAGSSTTVSPVKGHTMVLSSSPTRLPTSEPIIDREGMKGTPMAPAR